MMLFRLLDGQHIQADHTQEPVVTKHPTTGEETSKFPSRTYKAGETVPSEVDLVAKLGASKFQLIGGKAGKKTRQQLQEEIALLQSQLNATSSVAPPLDAKEKEALERSNPVVEEEEEDEELEGEVKVDLPDNLDEMTVAELRDFAETNEIDLSGAHNKARILATIKGE